MAPSYVPRRRLHAPPRPRRRLCTPPCCLRPAMPRSSPMAPSSGPMTPSSGPMALSCATRRRLHAPPCRLARPAAPFSRTTGPSRAPSRHLHSDAPTRLARPHSAPARRSASRMPPRPSLRSAPPHDGDFAPMHCCYAPPRWHPAHASRSCAPNLTHARWHCFVYVPAPSHVCACPVPLSHLLAPPSPAFACCCHPPMHPRFAPMATLQHGHFAPAHHHHAYQRRHLVPFVRPRTASTHPRDAVMRTHASRHALLPRRHTPQHRHRASAAPLPTVAHRRSALALPPPSCAVTRRHMPSLAALALPSRAVTLPSLAALLHRTAALPHYSTCPHAAATRPCIPSRAVVRPPSLLSHSGRHAPLHCHHALSHPLIRRHPPLRRRHTPHALAPHCAILCPTTPS
ncbi:hypothetical protein DENSPDRAFT_886897 [Dentipellis sp. KUC8613]|nr:hypothetical protein DENSPDRAFT_886897 [Dentipellis sp. KUC8613]